MTEAGFAGNQRYLMVTTAAVSVLGGIGAVRILQGVERLGERAFGDARAGAIAAAAALVAGLAISTPTIVAKADNTARVQGGLDHEAFLWHDLKAMIDENGGPDRLLACGGVFSGPFQTQMVAYELGVHGINVGWKETPPPGVVFRTRTVPDGPLVTKPTDDRYRLVDQTGKYADRSARGQPRGRLSGRESGCAHGPRPARQRVGHPADAGHRGTTGRTE